MLSPKYFPLTHHFHQQTRNPQHCFHLSPMQLYQQLLKAQSKPINTTHVQLQQYSGFKLTNTFHKIQIFNVFLKLSMCLANSKKDVSFTKEVTSFIVEFNFLHLLHVNGARIPNWLVYQIVVVLLLHLFNLRVGFVNWYRQIKQQLQRCFAQQMGFIKLSLQQNFVVYQWLVHDLQEKRFFSMFLIDQAKDPKPFYKQ